MTLEPLYIKSFDMDLIGRSSRSEIHENYNDERSRGHFEVDFRLNGSSNQLLSKRQNVELYLSYLMMPNTLTFN